jgi:hypothetical protein
MSILSHGIDRYQTYIASLAVAAPANGITNIEFLVSDHSEEWTEDTSYTVTFTTSSSKLQISAPNQFGALVCTRVCGCVGVCGWVGGWVSVCVYVRS